MDRLGIFYQSKHHFLFSKSSSKQQCFHKEYFSSVELGRRQSTLPAYQPKAQTTICHTNLAKVQLNKRWFMFSSEEQKWH
jgi:hypothetical protein